MTYSYSSIYDFNTFKTSTQKAREDTHGSVIQVVPQNYCTDTISDTMPSATALAIDSLVSTGCMLQCLQPFKDA